MGEPAEEPMKDNQRADEAANHRTELSKSVLQAIRSAVSERTAAAPESVDVSRVRRLSGGASRLTWEVLTDPGGAVIVQQERPGSAGANLTMASQSVLLGEAARCGVPVPEVLAAGEDSAGAFVVLARVEGESLPKRIRADAAEMVSSGELARQAGAACARIHAMDPRCAPELSEADSLHSMRSLLDALREPHPAFELGLAHLERTRPATRSSVVVHGDFRMGNLLVGSSGLSAVLDWELAHLGSPIEDLGWFCARAWRFGSPLRAGGVGTVEQLLTGYLEAGGQPVEPAELDWWETYACLRWGLICVLQASVHLSGLHRSVELAAIGRRAAECEEDLLELVMGQSNLEPPGKPAGRRVPPHDAPGASELLEAVAEQLESQMERASGADRFNLRVSANAVLLVERELSFGRLLVDRHKARLDALGLADDSALAEAIRTGAMDQQGAEVMNAVRGAVRDKLAVSNPGYWNGDTEEAPG